MTVSKAFSERLDRAIADIGGVSPTYKSHPNPEFVTATFQVPGLPDGQILLGANFFDFRRKCTDAMRVRGFNYENECQNGGTFNALVRNILPEDYEDGEIVGLDLDGNLLQWDGDNLSLYNCGETPEEFGLDNIRHKEMERIVGAMHAHDLHNQLKRAVASALTT